MAYDAAARALAPAVHVQVDEGSQLVGEELDMDARATVDVGRILPGQQADSHPEPPVSAAGSHMVTQKGPMGKTTIFPRGHARCQARCQARGPWEGGAPGGRSKQQSPHSPPPGSR